ncbi:MAG: hypothetical protein CVU84_14360 [Firmicutes bacterium HGW-Firmicutes-1]|jgi:hypothetical protein|nr:MAG: hypothetical protein CVU84_14360 [Firmicutes bacterium HGW-Firmicutes-1]
MSKAFIIGNGLGANLRNHKYLFLISLLYFILGFINIHFALLGFFCMIIPFILLFKTKKKTWCQGYCPRASLYTACGRVNVTKPPHSLRFRNRMQASKYSSRKTPQSFIHGNVKWLILSYFGINLFFLTMTTLRVGNGIMPPMAYIRFLLFFQIPVEMPQLIELNHLAPWITHLAYRFYSMMMTTTVIGLILAFIYKPRTWCTICPIATVSDVIIKKQL